MTSTFSRTLALAAVVIRLASAVTLDVNNSASIRNATSIVAHGLMSYYTGNITGIDLGLLPAPYYWWEAGSMWGGMIDYWHYTNDSTYNAIITAALLANVGPANDFIVPSQQFDEGNDDQSFWGMSAMNAVETLFPDPPSPTPSWLALAEAMWNTQVPRWNTASCNGGLKWQFYPANAGYDYKNSISNGAFFQMAARLLRYTGNTTYLDWAERSWNWSYAIGLVDQRTYAVYDGTDDTINCSEIDHDLWTYNLGVYLLGASTMYNYTNGSAAWETRLSGLVQATSAFFSPYPNASNIMFEASCESTSTCDPDQQSFKAYLARTMWKTAQLAPYTAGAISTVLRASARGAAASCSGSPAGVPATSELGTVCGSRWYTHAFDNVFGVGEQMSALEVMQGLLVNKSEAPAHGANVYLNTTAPAVVASTTLAVPSRTSAAAAAGTKANFARKGREHGVLGLGVAIGAVVVVVEHL